MILSYQKKYYFAFTRIKIVFIYIVLSKMGEKYVIKDILKFILDDDNLVHSNLLGTEPLSNKNQILLYLKSGYKISSLASVRECDICSETAGPRTYITDGFWVWPLWLCHYVEDHKIKLPDDLIKRIISNHGNVDLQFAKEVSENESTFID